MNDYEAHFDQVYFTAKTASITQRGKTGAAGTSYEVDISISFPVFAQVDEMFQKFSRVRAIRVHLNTGETVTLSTDRVDDAMPASSEMTLGTAVLSYTLNRITPLRLL